MTKTYELVIADDAEPGRLRGISHTYGGESLGEHNPYGVPCSTEVYAVEDRIADLFESDCIADPAVLAYSLVPDEKE